MTPITEVDAISSLDSVLTQIEDLPTRDRVLKWAWAKFATNPLPPSERSIAETIDGHSHVKKKVKATKKAKSAAKAKSSPSIVKDLNLSPKGKKSFKDFVHDKNPRSNQEKCTVSVYYLRRELNLATVSINHVYTCYKDAKWKVAGLYNVLVLTASRKGWLNTSDMESIDITTHGENLVEFDLPKKAKG